MKFQEIYSFYKFWNCRGITFCQDKSHPNVLELNHITLQRSSRAFFKSWLPPSSEKGKGVSGSLSVFCEAMFICYSLLFPRISIQYFVAYLISMYPGVWSNGKEGQHLIAPERVALLGAISKQKSPFCSHRNNSSPAPQKSILASEPRRSKLGTHLSPAGLQCSVCHVIAGK